MKALQIRSSTPSRSTRNSTSTSQLPLNAPQLPSIDFIEVQWGGLVDPASRTKHLQDVAGDLMDEPSFDMFVTVPHAFDHLVYDISHNIDKLSPGTVGVFSFVSYRQAEPWQLERSGCPCLGALIIRSLLFQGVELGPCFCFKLP